MRLLVIVAVLAGCWRGAEPAREPAPSFVARVDALAELQRNVDALAPRLDVVVQRIVGLASEAERAAIRQDLAGLERQVAALWRYTRDARSRGDDPHVLDAVESELQRTALAIVNLREELVYAKTTAELEALDDLGRSPDEPTREARRVQREDDMRRRIILRQRAPRDLGTEPGRVIFVP